MSGKKDWRLRVAHIREEIKNIREFTDVQLSRHGCHGKEFSDYWRGSKENSA
jgi:hypothetical protein